MTNNREVTTLIKIILHIKQVSGLLKTIARRLEERADTHDGSKFTPEEFTGFCQLDTNRGQQKEEYGSRGYEDGIKNIDAVKLHQSRNRHHPEYWPNGIKDMDFIDIVEMLCDWEAARRTRDTEEDIDKTWAIRRKRFGLSDEELAFLRTLWKR